MRVSRRYRWTATGDSSMGCCQGKRLFCPFHEKKCHESTRKVYLPASSADYTSSSCPAPRFCPENRPDFTEEQKRIVVESWKIIQQDIAKVGVVMFVGLFETHPDVQDIFIPFKGKKLEDLWTSTDLKSHVLRVMGTVEKCLARIHEPAKMESILHELGVKHLLLNIRVEYLDLIGPQFIKAVRPAMGDLWTPEVESAWANLFRLITHIMKEAMVL
ncbi:non-symbiotic hemoglobin 1-like isoform X1 [Pomacea canaliculata]|uniref:non-symbiotic hemoglobin 1-like isoform X1 n=1 Tax=Pomacea canaliculata TaxID=400727 RepID=UPI000D729546|nr:non-symbiotic hemoglobin 1-like isoform X1 [Pomacea canaliculata]XP_025105347.1 non-symbiotic hemoglobin 1-like isoform X1 [Pomacea canaliculata]